MPLMQKALRAASNISHGGPWALWLGYASPERCLRLGVRACVAERYESLMGRVAGLRVGCVDQGRRMDKGERAAAGSLEYT